MFAERGIPVETLRELGIGFWQRKRPRKSDAPDLLSGRLVFQIRGIRRTRDGSIARVILSHMGRAVTPDQEAQGGKWCMFHRFRIELYNIDLVLLDPEARKQAQSSGHILVTEGALTSRSSGARELRTPSPVLVRISPESKSPDSSSWPLN